MIRGVVASVLASSLFGAIYFYVTMLHPMSSMEIFAWRLTMTAPAVTLLYRATGELSAIRLVAQDIRRRPWIMIAHAAHATMMGGQIFLFMWGPVNGQALEASLGYFLMPLCLVLAGRSFFPERMSRFQVAATLVAAIGVDYELRRIGTISWVVLFVALGYTAYFVSRRTFQTLDSGSSWLEMQMIGLIAAGLLLSGSHGLDALQSRPVLWLLAPMLGVIRAVAMSSYFAAGRLLNFVVFGLLGYLEPVLLVFVAFVIGESIGVDELPTYLPIWLAILILTFEGLHRLQTGRRIPRARPKAGNV